MVWGRPLVWRRPMRWRVQRCHLGVPWDGRRRWGNWMWVMGTPCDAAAV
jgi:hypothetical protein